MISRALVLALWCACAAALAPLAAQTDDDCALYLTGPGRSSAYDYSLNLLKGNFGYEGQHTCITYDAINQAYLDARNRILVAQPKGDWKAEDFASVGELILDISINLARTYGLTYEEIEKGLPLIDTSRTLIREVCPPVFSHVECRAGKYRRFDGLCNNLRHPTWGATMAPFQRLIGPLFADGINAPRIAHNGHDLPLSRVVSRTMHPDDGFHDHAGTVMVIAWGQFMDHDYTLTGTPLDPINRNDPEECCKRPLHLKHPYCNEIRVPDDDYFYRLWGVKCIDFVRGFPSPRPGCRLGSRVPFNTLTGSIDGNTVYGVTEKFARKLRTGYGGLLRMNPVFKEYGLKDLLPLKLDIPDEGCTRPNKNMYCFEAGEIRVNEQLVLTVMHTLMTREHNRVAEGLAAVNPHWDDETLFQEARRINIAEIQFITYNEFLPILLGKDVMEKFGLVLEKEGYWDGYDEEVNPDVLASFAAAAYRFGHSLLPTAVERWSKAHKFIASKRLSDLIRRPYDLYRAGVLDEYVMGLMNQVAQAMDDSITQEVTNHLFKKVGARFGMDLVSFNMQRGREFGLPGYMEFRKFCGLSGADTFQDLFGSMANETVRKYETIFEHPIDVDLWSGGVSERPLPGSMLGPTFACIIATQFSYSRRGDRFWFELPNQPSSFTPEQLKEIRKARLARVICDNTDIIDTVQLYPMVLPDHELNPRVPCRSGIIPSMDFSKWAEPVPFHGAAKQFVTDAVARNGTTDCDQSLNQNNTVTEASQANNVTENLQIDIPCTEVSALEGSTSLSDHTNQLIIEAGTNQSMRDSVYEPKNQECLNKVNTTPNCLEDKAQIQISENNDTVLKYVYKKNDKLSATSKTKGHKKNSLERKRRSLDTDSHIDEKIALPVSVDYTTLHTEKERDEIVLPQDPVQSIIKKSDLANFNIETLHKDINTPSGHIKENIKPHIETDNSSQSRESSEDSISKEHEELDKIKQNHKNSEDDSRESVESSENSNHPRQTAPYTENAQNSNESEERSEELTSPIQANKESEEIDSFSREEPTPDKLNLKQSPGSAENISQPSKKSPDYEKSNESNDESLESDEEKPDEKISHYKSEDDPTSRVIQDVDSGDFGYDKKHVNKKGEINPTNDLHNLEESTPASFKQNYNIKSNENKEKYRTVLDDVEPATHDSSESVSQPVNINDGEVKPVIELNNDSNESTEENTQVVQNAHLKKIDDKNESSSIEEVNDKDIKEKIVLEKENEGGKENVKQQFERIPLDYKHENKKNNETDRSAENLNNNNDEDENDGTLDAISPRINRYDDKLNIKFNDISIKLPEIKLPDDILSYSYIDAPQDEHKNKEVNKKPSSRFYYYNDDESEENLNNKKKNVENKPKKQDYYDYYRRDQNKDHDSYKKSGYHGEGEGDDEEEDLYEKFVRERFGKRGSFGKRSEKLQREEIGPANPKLLKTIQNILQKTENVHNEAEKSGDPNAAYMWTLEYGEKL